MISEDTKKKIKAFKKKFPIYRIKYTDSELGAVTLIKPIKTITTATMFMSKDTFRVLNQLCIL